MSAQDVTVFFRNFMKFFKNKTLFSFLVLCLISQCVLPWNTAYAAVSPMVADFLCEKGTRYYENGMYPEALQEFKKALLANPKSAVAQEYVEFIEKKQLKPSSYRAVKDAFVVLSDDARDSALKEFESKRAGSIVDSARAKDYSRIVDQFQKAVLTQKRQKNGVIAQKQSDSRINAVLQPSSEKEATIIDLRGINENGIFDAQAQVEDSFVIRGKNITKFVVTDPALLKVTRRSSDELFTQASNIGSSHIHIWDDGQRKSLKFDIKPRMYEEEIRREEREKRREDVYVPQSFKMSYSIEGSSFMTGKEFSDLHRSSYNWLYRWGLRGETPFGNFDSAIQGSRTLQKTYRVSNLRLALTDAHYDQFKDITIRGFDFTPSCGAFGFVSSDLRGLMVRAPMFNKKINYMVFSGALPQGSYTSLSTNSGLSPTKKAWLEGITVNYRINRSGNLETFYSHSYGPERAQPVLTSDTAGADMTYNLGKVRLGSGVVSDMRYYSYRANCDLSLNRFFAGLSMVEMNKNFRSLLGGSPASGSTSGSLSLSYQLTPTINISNTFSGYRDKVFYNPENPGRPNYTGTTSAVWNLDRHTFLQLDYIVADQKGTNSPSITETKNISFRKTFYFIRKLNGYINYSNSKNKNYFSPAQDYNNNRIYMGLNCQMIENLFCYYNNEVNILMNKYSQATSLPTAQEIGFQYNRQIMTAWPLFLDMRLYYRNERQADSVLDYLSGQDRVEANGGLTLRPNKDSEVFFKCRISNIWNKLETVEKHLDLDLNWGIRFLWDTGLRWDTVGCFDGFVFYDTNGDGVMQTSEKGVVGALVVGPSNKTAKTDKRGYYKLTQINGKTAYLELDLSTIPKKYNPTTATVQKHDIVFGKTRRINFGIATRSDIEGIIFDDQNKNGQYDAGEPLVSGIIIILDEKDKMVSNIMGAFRFRNVAPGEHVIKIDLKSIPIKFIPKVPISKKVNIEQGAVFSYPIALEKTK